MSPTEDIFLEAQAHADAGHFSEAASLCETLLKQAPNHHAARHLCGVAYLNCGRIAEAVLALKAAAEARPQDPVVWFDLGLAQLAAALPSDAAVSYNHVIALKPDHLDAWSRLTVAYKRMARWENAATAGQRALELAPTSPELAYTLGHIFLELRRWNEAAAAFQQALNEKSPYPEALNGLGLTLKATQQYDKARGAFEKALAQRPHYLEALFNLGTVLQMLERWSDAVDAYKDALAVAPGSVEALGNLGNSLFSAREFGAAATIHQKVVSLRPNHPPAHNNLGNALLGLKRFTEAKACFDRALALQPDDPNTLCNLGNVFLAQNKLDDAYAFYHQALQIQPGFSQAIFNEGLVLLLKGNLRAGWPRYELRWVLKRQARSELPPRDNWEGDTPIEGKTLLLCAEQGLGDTLQFVRYVPLLTARGAKVILRVQAALKQLLAALPDVTIVTNEEETVPPFDQYCLLASMPLAFRTDLNSIPATIPYIQAPPAKAALWRDRLGWFPGLKIGLICSGNPKHRNDYNRSCPLAAFKTLTTDTETKFCLLQKDFKPDDAATLAHSPEFINLSAELHDFTDTAAIVANLDLIISVDSSVAHLAGAMGKPVWTLLPFAPDWRWMVDRLDSPWYPTMRLFRQPAPDDWAAVINQVAVAFSAFCSQH